MDITVSFPGGKRVDARVGSHLVQTDQPLDLGGQDSAPSPFDLFLASIATCTGIYVLGFCRARNIDTDGLAIRQRVSWDAESHQPRVISIEVVLPRDFPAKYRAAILRTAESCKVKKAIAAQPTFDVSLAD